MLDYGWVLCQGMFTGIIEEVGRVVSAQPQSLTISARTVLSGMKPGDSVAVNGVCLTVTTFSDTSFSADVMPETKRRTNLGLLRAGDGVNLERPLTLGGRLGGHLVQGHIDATGQIVAIAPEDDAFIISVEAPPEVMRFVVEKGFITVDGISLTVVTREESTFSVSIVDFTFKHTTLHERRVGDTVNLETDIIGKYVDQLTQVGRPGITKEFLQEHGFMVS